MTQEKTSTRRKKLRSNLVRAIYELIEDKIDDFIKYEEQHLFDVDEIERVLGHNIDQRIAKIQEEDLREEITTRRRRRAPRGTSTVRIQTCTIAGCSRPARSRGLCAAHYQAFRRNEKRHQSRAKK